MVEAIIRRRGGFVQVMAPCEPQRRTADVVPRAPGRLVGLTSVAGSAIIRSERDGRHEAGVEYTVNKVVEVPGTCAEAVIMGESSPKCRAPMRSYFVDAVLNLAHSRARRL
jgi:hypothetical protein